MRVRSAGFGPSDDWAGSHAVAHCARSGGEWRQRQPPDGRGTLCGQPRRTLRPTGGMTVGAVGTTRHGNGNRRWTQMNSDTANQTPSYTFLSAFIDVRPWPQTPCRWAIGRARSPVPGKRHDMAWQRQPRTDTDELRYSKPDVPSLRPICVYPRPSVVPNAVSFLSQLRSYTAAHLTSTTSVRPSSRAAGTDVAPRATWRGKRRRERVEWRGPPHARRPRNLSPPSGGPPPACRRARRTQAA